ncbi:MAG: UbiA family prenyltransferase [Nitrospiraceae bacterium]
MKQNSPTSASPSPSLSPQSSVNRARLLLYLRLGRVSNLPTVWTNTLAGVVLAGGTLSSIQLPALLAAFTLFYTGGMFLNDAFDREFDARERSERPIPSGLIAAGSVFRMGYGMVVAGIVIVVWLGLGKGWGSAVSAIALAAAIIGYDANHKHNPLGPAIMGLCRALIYITAAITVTGHLTAVAAGGAAALFGYVTGLTYVAKRKTASPRTVTRLIAGISLLDAVLMGGRGAVVAAGMAVLAFLLTLRWQRSVQGT